MKINFLPKSCLGTTSAALNIFSVSTFIIFYIFAELLKVITSDILVTIFGVAAVIASITAFFTGVTAVVKNKERSVLVFLSIIIGFVVIAFIIGDIFLEH